MTAAIAGTIVPRAAAVASRSSAATGSTGATLTKVRPIGAKAPPVSKGQVASGAANAGLSYSAGKRGGRAGARSASTGSAPGSAQRILIAELLVCVIVLALSPLSSPEGSVSAKDWMKRGTAVAALFIILGMVANVGPRSGRVAAAFGGIVALVLLIDQRSIFAVMTDKLRTLGADKPSSIAPGDGPGGSDVGTWNPGPIPNLPGVPGIPGLPPMPPLYSPGRRRGGSP